MTGSVVPPTTISDETVEAAATAIYDEAGPESIDRDGAEAFAVAALAAVVPYIEAGLRETLEAVRDLHRHGQDRTVHRCQTGHWENAKRGLTKYWIEDNCPTLALLVAARVDRETQEATK